MKANQKVREFLKNNGANTTAMAIFSVIFLVVGIAVAGLLFTFTEVLGGQTYNLVEDDIAAINNSTIRSSIQAGILSNFEAQEQIGNYMPIIVLAVIITIIIGLIISGIAARFMGPAMGGYGGYGGYGGQVL